jgi:hypothetical protein
MACSSCGSRNGARKGVRPNSKGGFVSRAKKLPWAHVSPRGNVARYATEKEAQAAVKMFGGKAEKRTD